MAPPKERRSLVSERWVAEQLGIPMNTLAKARSTRQGVYARLPFYRLGRWIKYDERDVERFVESCRVEPVVAEPKAPAR
jgi:hypothetical protein